MCVCVCVCERERERETDRQTDRQRQTERKRERQRQRQRDGHTQRANQKTQTPSIAFRHVVYQSVLAVCSKPSNRTDKSIKPKDV